MGLDGAVSHLGWSGHKVWDKNKEGLWASASGSKGRRRDRWPLEPCNPDHFFPSMYKLGPRAREGSMSFWSRSHRGRVLGVRCFQAKSRSPGLRQWLSQENVKKRGWPGTLGPGSALRLGFIIPPLPFGLEPWSCDHHILEAFPWAFL